MIKNMKILIVEDEEILKKVLQEKLESENFTIKIATDGEMAMSLAKEFKPDLILLDIILSKKDGIQVLQELKANNLLSKIPVIMVSNLGDEEIIKRAMKLGAMDYLIKTQHSLDDVANKAKEYFQKLK
jgi:two-component system alkaline phosphatase synthesis response regulator PhoP